MAISGAGASAGWCGDVISAQAPRVSERTALRLPAGIGTRKVNCRPPAATLSNVARSRYRSLPHRPEPLSAVTARMPLASSP